tara:strand:+ start:526 stop:699 length:174 start_codon:yes stop_codon:yes gene_type:complete
MINFFTETSEAYNAALCGNLEAPASKFSVAAPCYAFCVTLVILKPSSDVGAIKYFVI